MSRLRFYARGTAECPDPHALERRNVRRCIGRRLQEIIPGRFGFVPTGKPEETDYHPDLLKACKAGDLWPADEATAKACGVGFDPLFGEEPTQTIKEFRATLETGDTTPAPTAPAPKKSADDKAGKVGS